MTFWDVLCVHNQVDGNYMIYYKVFVVRRARKQILKCASSDETK